MRGRRDGDDHSIYASEGGKKPNKTRHQVVRALLERVKEEVKSLKNCGFEIFSFFSCPSARRRVIHICCERKLRNRSENEGSRIFVITARTRCTGRVRELERKSGRL